MILDQLAAHAQIRVMEAKKRVAFDDMENAAYDLPRGDFPFAKALKKAETTFICELKKASPSKGVIDPDFSYLEIAKSYEDAGVDCLSCLTEPKWFLGSDEIFQEVRAKTNLPMLRKDFVVSAYQIYEAKCMGADAVLLIAALLGTKTIANYLEICADLGLSAIVETHDDLEIRSAVAAGAQIIGVNNRNLKDFSVNINNAPKLRELVPPHILFVAESGISGPADVTALGSVDGILVGELMMRSKDKGAILKALREAAR